MLLYKNGSVTGREIASRLGIGYRTTGQGGIDYKCINWGSNKTRLVSKLPHAWLNKRQYVEIAQCKLKSFEYLDGNVRIPKWTTSRATAKEWINEGGVVYCRTMLRANQGRGIVVARDVTQLVTAPLYTLKVDADREYRVHVFKGNAIIASRKRENEDFDGEVNDDVRNHGRGWFFSLCDLGRVHSDIKNEAISAINSLGLDFGAVDLMWNTGTQQATILEVNTAPSLEGTSLDTYVECFQRWIDGEDTERRYNVSWTQPVTRRTTNNIDVVATSRADAIRQIQELIDDDDGISNISADTVRSSSSRTLTADFDSDDLLECEEDDED